MMKSRSGSRNPSPCQSQNLSIEKLSASETLTLGVFACSALGIRILQRDSACLTLPVRQATLEKAL